MRSTLHYFLAAFAMITWSLDLVSALELRKYFDGGCPRNGDGHVCRDVSASTCCGRQFENGIQVFSSAACYGNDCTSNMRHRVYNYRFDAPYPLCGTTVATNNAANPNCISPARRDLITGHAWFHGARLAGQALNEEVNEDACIGSVEPDIYILGGRWFEINETTPEDVKKMIWSLSDSRSFDAARSITLPVELDRFETTWRPEEF